MKKVITSSTSSDKFRGIKEQAAIYYIQLQTQDDQHLAGVLDGIVYTLACVEDKSQFQVFNEIKQISEATYEM